MKTFVHLTTLHPRFDSRISLKQANTLARSFNHQVVLIVADGDGDDIKPIGEVSVRDLGILPKNRILRFIIGSYRALLLVLSIRPDVIHFHDPELIPVSIIFKILQIKIIYDVHENLPDQILYKKWLPSILRPIVSFAIKLVEKCFSTICNNIVTATPRIETRFPRSKAICIQNFPQLSEFQFANFPPYSSRPLSLVYAGYLEPERGIREVIQSIELVDNFNSLKLDLAGQFVAQSFEDELKLTDGWQSVNYHGWVSREKLEFLLSQARAGLVLHHPVPNELDGQPIKLFEYMAAGLPIIASDFPLWRKFIDHSKCGILVDPFDLSGIASSIRWIFEHPVEAEAMGKRGRLAAEQIFNWESEGKKLIAMYQKLL